MEQEHYEKSVSCPHDSIHPAWCSCGCLLVCSTQVICIHQSCIWGQFPLKGHVPRLEALDLQMNQIVYTFLHLLRASHQSNPMQTRRHLAEFSGILLDVIRICFMSWSCMVFTMGSPFVRIKLCSIIFFQVLSVSHSIITCVHYMRSWVWLLARKVASWFEHVFERVCNEILMI